MAEQTQTIVIDAKNATLGRLASYAAKQSLQGKKIIILNSERAIVTGNKVSSINKYLQRIKRGGSAQRGPFFPRSAEKILKRTIRGMLPDFKRGRGKEAFKRIICFKGIPEEYKEAKTIKAGKEKHTSYMNLEQLSKKI